MNFHKIVIIGDSLSFSRQRKGQIFSQSWPFLISDALQKSIVWQRSKGGAMITDILDECNTLSAYLGSSPPPFDFFIIQVGIVDCCPRPYPIFIDELLNKLPNFGVRIRLRTRLKDLLNKVSFILRLPRKPWMSPSRFKKNLLSVLSMAKSVTQHIVFLEIAPATNYLVINEPSIQLNIEKYNDILLEEISHYNSTRTGNDLMASYLEMFKNSNNEDLFLEDGHHLTALGHEYVAGSILKYINNKIGE
jgi:acyl-CoA thioesterase I